MITKINKTKGNVMDDKADKTNKKEDSFVTKSELEAFGNSLINNMKDLFKKELDVHTEALGKTRAIPSCELGKDTRGIEPVAEHLFKDTVELEAFMNQELVIYVHPSNNKEDNPVIVPNVNGINQPIIRGQVCRVKRKFVEALARNRHTRYDQKIPDPTKPHRFIMDPDRVVKDPFTVRHDPHKLGPQWLQNILAEA